MQVITLETKIAAPVQRCFLLSLNVDLHVQSTAKTNERAIAGITHGLMELGDKVTWRARHFGLMLTHETLISRYEMPLYFQDVMLKGMFRSFVHDHYFTHVLGDQTLMRDKLSFEAPLGPIGRVVEVLILKNYLSEFLRSRNTLIRHVAEGPKRGWRSLVTQ